jgi:hypothetical protein
LSFHRADEEKKRASLASEDRIELKVYGIEAAGRGPFIYYVGTFLGFNESFIPYVRLFIVAFSTYEQLRKFVIEL